MSNALAPDSRSGKASTGFPILCAVLALATLIGTSGKLHRLIHEWFMPRVTSAHYEVLFPAGAVPADAMSKFASGREPLFETLNRKLDDAASNDHLTLVFDLPSPAIADTAAAPYSVEGTMVRTHLTMTPNGAAPQLDPAADAEALLHAAWGQPGSPQISYWTSLWLVGQWQGQELGMAAAEIEQKTGYKKVANLLGPSPAMQQTGTQQMTSKQMAEMLAPHDRDLLVAAWLNEVSELSGPAAVRKLYSARLAKMNLSDAAVTLGTNTPELERKWQLWIYSYIAGMPAGGRPMIMTPPAAK